jgi:methionine-gamma-lyase
VRCLELKLADLEGAENAIAFNSGMAAVSTTLLTLTERGGHVVASDRVYEVTHRFMSEDLPAAGASVTFVDTGDPDAVEAAIRPETRLIYAEPFSNPHLRVTDPRPLAEIAHRHGLPLVMDNTFLSPALLRPLEFGADLVIHSATKYLSGNGQVQGGIVAGPSRRITPIRERMIRLGTVMQPFAAWILLAGIHTLPLRMERHSHNAYHLARLLEAHPAVETVHYPGLYSDAGYAIAAALVGAGDDRFGGMLSFSLSGNRIALGRFIDALELCTIAVSLGDASTLVWPWPDGTLIRMSVGLEDFADLAADLRRALSVVIPATVA